MDHDRIVRESEQAAVARWFPKGPMGQMFDAGGGPMLNMRADAVAAWKQEAFALIDRFISDSRTETKRLIPAFIVFAIAAVSVARWIGMQSGASVMGAVGLGALAFHIWPTWQLWRYRRALAALRARIRGSLGAATPLPPDYGARFKRRNPWRIALHVWVWGLVLAALAGQHFLTPDDIPVAGIGVALAAVGVAWLLHFLSRGVDLRGPR